MKKSVRIAGAILLLPVLGLIAYYVYNLTLPREGSVSWAGVLVLLLFFAALAAFFVAPLAGRPLISRHPLLAGLLLLVLGGFMLIPRGSPLVPLLFILAGANCIAGLPGVTSGRGKVVAMMKKLSRIFGIAASSLIMLSYLLFVAVCINTIALPDNEVHFESKGYAGGFLIVFALPAVVSVAGFIGSLLAKQKPKLGGLLMAICGVVTLLFGMPFIIFSIPYDIRIWLERIPPFILIIVGAFSLSFMPDTPAVSIDDDRGPPSPAP